MDRPKDFKKCAKHAVSSLIRNMPRIKEEISDYFYSYSQKFQCSKQSKEKKINKVKPVEEKPWNVKPLDGKPVDNLRLNRKGQLKRYGES